MRKILLGHFSKICCMLLSKIQQSCCYSQMCNYGIAIAFKPIRKQLNIVVACNLSFTRSLNAS